ncbi:hypothetical protein RM351_000098 [Enterobacter kobei]|nr:hypothetical protein [Enterobacter kobei]
MIQDNDILKYAAPLIIFILGIFFAPYIESRKEKSKAKRIYNALIVEIEDELKELPLKLQKIAMALEGANNFKNHQPEIGDIVKYVPRDIFLYFTKQTMDSSFKLLNKDQRNAMKSLIVLIEAINKYSNDIKDCQVTDARIGEIINNYKRYLYTGPCIINTMRIVLNKTKVVSGKSDNDIIKEVLSEFEINISIDELRIKRTVTLDSA